MPHGVPDLERFAVDVAARLSAGAWPRSAIPHSGDSVFVARAPGRLDVMGGIADYSGALVLQWPIREATRVGCRLIHVDALMGDGENRVTHAQPERKPTRPRWRSPFRRSA
jgi:hypothetical protein